MRRTLWWSALLVAVAACASGRSQPTSGGREVITEQEIASTKASDAYQVIQQLRADFLRSRGRTSFRDAAPPTADVFVDGRFFGSLESLRGIQASDITTIRFLKAADATIKYGTGHVAGVIEVMTRH